MTGRSGDLVLTNFYNPHLLGEKPAQRRNTTNTARARVENMYIRILTELACNRFEWVGLPDSINPRFLELELFWKAVVIYYHEDAVGKDLAAKGAGYGFLDPFDDPTSFQVVGPGYMTIELDVKECVPIYANYLRVPDLDIVYIYAEKLARIDRAIDMTVTNMQMPKIIKASEATKLSMANIDRQHDEGVSSIKVSKSLNLNDEIEVLDLGVPSGYLSDLQIGKAKMWNECMGKLGINNSNQDKKERLVADEVAANDEQVEATKNIALNARQHAAEQINKMFGTTISVDFKTSTVPEPDDADDNEQDGE